MSGRRIVAVAAAALVAAAQIPPAADAHRGTPEWSLPTLLSRIGGARVSVGSWSGRVQAASTLCNGEGRGRKWSGMRHWRHFTCTWTVFDRRSAGERDVTFRVHTLTTRRYRITNARFGAY
ncbi:MAG: hypothetical protein ACJ744_17090 [Gaiellaceae bacterium]